MTQWGTLKDRDVMLEHYNESYPKKLSYHSITAIMV